MPQWETLSGNIKGLGEGNAMLVIIYTEGQVRT